MRVATSGVEGADSGSPLRMGEISLTLLATQFQNHRGVSVDMASSELVRARLSQQSAISEDNLMMLANRFAAVWLAVAAMCGALADTACAQSTRQGDLSFVHGLPGDNVGRPRAFPVNVSVALETGGAPITFFNGVNFRSVNGPLRLAVGVYTVTVTEANPPNPGVVPAIQLSTTVEIRAGENIAVVAGLTASKLPQLVVFKNDVSRIAFGRTRLNVRHLAGAGPVDVALQSTIGLPSASVNNLANPAESPVINMLPGTYVVRVKAAGTPTELLPAASVPLAQRIGYFVYAVGDPANGTLGLVIQPIPLRLRLVP
jgi:hypothetical protein